ncbi:MAG: hypothetical protein DI635_10530 [Pseudoxanthomonas suwonensis]|nr:MAG: hypothetical protein DI635_10530 [Pseudoxanthomonas suwonensis]
MTVQALQWLALAVAAGLLLWAGRGLPWFKLQGDAEAQRVLLIATLVLCAMRGFNADALPGVKLHFLGAAIAALMFGARFALWVMAIVSLAAWATGHAWLGWATDFLVTGALPIAVVQAGLHLAQRHLPANVMVYIMVNAFLAGAASMGASMLAKALLAGWFAADTQSAYLLATVPLMFAEGFFSGGTLALIVVYRPQWCSSFDDQRYLQ